MIKTVIALTVAAGFATASFAQGATPATPATPAAPAAKVVAPAPVTMEKKVEAPKAAEPAKGETATAEKVKHEGKHKAKGHGQKPEKTEAQPAAAMPAPTAK